MIDPVEEVVLYKLLNGPKDHRYADEIGNGRKIEADGVEEYIKRFG